MSVGLVVVSHSAPLAEAAIALAREMLGGRELAVLAAAGLDDGSVGTDAAAISAAIEAADSGDGVVVLMDLGSAVLSAEMALEFLNDEARARVVLCPAPLVEGLVVAVTVAAAGADRDTVAAEAAQALAPKVAQLPEFAAAADRPGASGTSGPGAGAGADGLATPRPEAADGAEDVRATFVVLLPHGLHARPVARLVGAIAEFDARVEVRNASTGSSWVNARSVAGVAGLGVRQGHELEVRARGDGARAAVDAVLAEAQEGFGEGEAAAEAAVAVTEAPPQQVALPWIPYGEAVGLGAGALPVSPGIAVGVARLEGALAAPDEHPGSGIEIEEQRLAAALDAAEAHLELVRERAAAELGAHEAGIFTAQALMLRDPLLTERAGARLRDGVTAERAWWEATGEAAAALAALPDDYQRARAEDVRAVAGMVLGSLRSNDFRAGGPADSGMVADRTPQPTAAASDGRVVLVAAELSAAQAATLQPDDIAGVVLTRGSATSHAAILLRARGIPAVLTNDAAVASLSASAGAGPVVALDGRSGELLVDPDSTALAAFQSRARAEAEHRTEAHRRSGEPALTRDGVEVLVGANLGSERDAAAALAEGADLAGLVRTEFLFLDRPTPPSVEEQVAAYRALATAFGGRRLTLRTLDIGGDKPVPYVTTPPEDNPFLGIRGLRLSLTHPRLLHDQLTAIVTVAHETPVSVMFPMVATTTELHAALTALDETVVALGRGRPAGLQVGVMVEIPALALKTAQVAGQVDFLSLGTNDLTQYALAADRGHEQLAALADPLDPGVLRLIAAVGADAGPALVAVCGELASDVDAIPVLLGLGVRELSVSPAAVALTKQRVRGVDTTGAAELARQVLELATAGEVRVAVRSWTSAR